MPVDTACAPGGAIALTGKGSLLLGTAKGAATEAATGEASGVDAPESGQTGGKAEGTGSGTFAERASGLFVKCQSDRFASDAGHQPAMNSQEPTKARLSNPSAAGIQRDGRARAGSGGT
jgi:hypothetical protein